GTLNGVAGTIDFAPAGFTVDPRYVIEEVGLKPNELNKGHDPGDDFPVFQITARSVGASGNANTVLQSTFARPF
ncbi:MAG: pilus assembly protein, partial [Steroidobacteraceae bacterium]